MAVRRSFWEVKECLEYLVEIQSSRDERSDGNRIGSKNSQSIFNNR